MQAAGTSSTAYCQTEKGAKKSKDEKRQSKEYEVEKIIFHEVLPDATVYLVKWKHCAEEQCTWEPEENLENCEKILLRYKTIGC
ncbi:heterochromatin protein 1-like [Rhopalosiphum padi]|uniref:heterochromatin protein 1-like n=1 Tax=Rhopalosiphum padi TaxID=40932 RepID=UPI00298DA9E4|nr:heterochromatin protein 1-like [Rhopalosiphum padi]XP_060839012.1 heterochromatin protein 1-like [Rhopalosiphum padi]